MRDCLNKHETQPRQTLQTSTADPHAVHALHANTTPLKKKKSVKLTLASEVVRRAVFWRVLKAGLILCKSFAH